jgi:ribonuclease P protein component
MLPKKKRITQKDIEALFINGLNLRIRNLVFKFCLNNLKYNRYGISISKKHTPLATDRNKLKREIYNSIQILEDRFSNKCFFNILCLVSRKDVSILEINKELKIFFEHLCKVEC